MNLSFYQRPDFPGAGITWTGTGSTGTSGTHSCPAGTNSATLGTSVNGHVPARFAAAQSAKADTTIDAYITVPMYRLGVMFKASAAVPDNVGSPFLNPQVLAMSNFAALGINFSTAGMQAWVLSSFVGYKTNTHPAAVGSWHAAMVYYDDVNFFSRLDNGIWVSKPVVDGFNGQPLNTINLQFGATTYSASNFSGDTMEGFCSKVLTADPQAQFDDWYSYLKSKYPAAALP